MPGEEKTGHLTMIQTKCPYCLKIIDSTHCIGISEQEKQGLNTRLAVAETNITTVTDTVKSYGDWFGKIAIGVFFTFLATLLNLFMLLTKVGGV